MATPINLSDSPLIVTDCFKYDFSTTAPTATESTVMWYELRQNGDVIGQRFSLPETGNDISIDLMNLAKSLLKTPCPDLSIPFVTTTVPTAFKEFELIHDTSVTTVADGECETVTGEGKGLATVSVLNSATQNDENGWFGDFTGIKLMTRRSKFKRICSTDFDFIHLFKPKGSSSTVQIRYMYKTNSTNNFTGIENITLQNGVNSIGFGVNADLPDLGVPVIYTKFELLIDGQVAATNILENCSCPDCETQILYFEPLGGWSVMSFKKNHTSSVNTSGSAICIPVNCKSQKKLINVKSSQSNSFTKEVNGCENVAMLRAFAASPERYILKKDFEGNYYKEEFYTESGTMNIYEKENVVSVTITGTTSVHLPTY